MAINHDQLFKNIKAIDHDGKLEQIQVDSVNCILEACEQHCVTDDRQVAYIMATAFHECRFKPVEEVGKGAGYAYGKKIKMSRQPYSTPNKIYYGRGFVQLTWYENYAAFGKQLNIDLLNKPELALQPDIAAQIIVLGMKKGMFTGKKLSDYFDHEKTQPINARKIVNGTDKQMLIAGYYETLVKGI